MSNQIYAYIRNIAKVSRGYISKLAEKNGLTMAEALVLLSCGNSEGCTQKEIIRYCGMDKSMITLSVKNLSRNGFLRQEKDKNDKRCMQVFLTEKGRTMFQILNRSLLIFNNGTVSSLPRGEAETLEILLGKLSSYLDKFDL